MRLLSALSLSAVICGASLSGAAFAETAKAPAPNFSVTATDGKTYDIEKLRGKVVVLEWFNKGCPFVQRVYENNYMQGLQAEYGKQGIVWLTVNSTHEGHGDYIAPKDVSAALGEWKAQPTGYIADADGKLGKLFDAKTTPTMVVIDKNGAIAYQGALDNYPQADDDAAKTVHYTRDALQALVSGQPIMTSQTKSYGCSVKYAG
ncbi:MAG: redoxin family protein [Deltaproteobacteria bacterium]|nr:redoxin family protein [Deltaproteobacteria bacterium]